MLITIDGPAGAGKSTVAKLVATKLGFDYLDTGAMYRTVALLGLEKKIDWNHPEQLVEMAKSLRFETISGRTIVDGRDVSDAIRSPEVTQNTHFAADHPGVREILVERQREIAKGKNIVTEGRDQGTAVFPDAEYKFYLVATPQERAGRRIEEFRQKGVNFDEANVLEQINLRDARDSSRKVGPLCEPKNAIRIVTDHLSVDQVVSEITKHTSASAASASAATRLFRIAFGLAVFTIVYNLVEGGVSTFFGYEDESLALFGFGVDSFIEVISGIGIAIMIMRIWQNPESSRSQFETAALRITGSAFYLLVLGLLVTVVHNLWTGKQPETTFWGIVISVLSIAVMWALYRSKRVVGRKLNSDAILADAECTMTCISMSVILLISSLLYEAASIPYIDTIGTLGIIWYSWREGIECLEKARTNNVGCSCHSCHKDD